MIYKTIVFVLYFISFLLALLSVLSLITYYKGTATQKDELKKASKTVGIIAFSFFIAILVVIKIIHAP